MSLRVNWIDITYGLSKSKFEGIKEKQMTSGAFSISLLSPGLEYSMRIQKNISVRAYFQLFPKYGEKSTVNCSRICEYNYIMDIKSTYRGIQKGVGFDVNFQKLILGWVYRFGKLSTTTQGSFFDEYGFWTIESKVSEKGRSTTSNLRIQLGLRF